MSNTLAEYLEVVALAIVQGLGEFLPISSSGHVLVLAHLFDALAYPLHEKLTVNAMLHLGTLLAVVLYLRRRILDALLRQHRVLWLVVVGTLPAALVGIGYDLFGKEWFITYLGVDPLDHVFTAGVMFLVTGVILLLTGQLNGQRSANEISVGQALLIGIAQAFAILPGLSRSGMTIAAGLACGLRREEAAAFSFLLSIPAIAGAGVIEGRKLLDPASFDASVGPLLIGVVVSFVVGLAGLAWLMRWLTQGRWAWFAGWVFVVGTAVLLWQVGAGL